MVARRQVKEVEPEFAARGAVTPRLPPAPQSFVLNFNKNTPSEEDLAQMEIPEFLRREVKK